jgi:hypothetical protein
MSPTRRHPRFLAPLSVQYGRGQILHPRNPVLHRKRRQHTGGTAYLLTGRGAGCCKRNSSKVSLGIDSC